MDKKLIGLVIAIIFAVIAVSGCASDDNGSMNVPDNNHQDNDASHKNEEKPVSKNNNQKSPEVDPEPNEEPEPPSDEQWIFFMILI